MNHSPAITSEAGEYGDNGVFGTRSTRRFWVAECSCGWHAGSGIGLSWFDTKREAMDAWRAHAGDTKGDQGMTTELCTDRLERCRCSRTKDHDGSHGCECGGSWEHDGSPVAMPPEGSPHCCSFHAEHPTTV